MSSMKLFDPVFNWWYDLNSSMKEINPLVSFIFSILTLAMLIINIAMLPFLGLLVSIKSVFRGLTSLTKSNDFYENGNIRTGSENDVVSGEMRNNYI